MFKYSIVFTFLFWCAFSVSETCTWTSPTVLGILSNYLFNSVNFFYLFAVCVVIGDFPGGSVVKNLHAKQEMRVWSLDWEDLLEEEVAFHSSILAGKIPWTEEPGGLQSIGLKRVRHDSETEHACCLYEYKFRIMSSLWIESFNSMNFPSLPLIVPFPLKSTLFAFNVVTSISFGLGFSLCVCIFFPFPYIYFIF